MPQTKSNRLLIGKILRPRGLAGELKLQLTIDKGQLTINDIYIDNVKYHVTKFNRQDEYAYIKLENVNTIEQAETLRNKQVYIDAAAITLNPDEVLVDDIIGFSVVDEKGTKLGTLKFVENYGASDVFDCGTFSFPNEDAFVVETNITERKIVIRAELL